MGFLISDFMQHSKNSIDSSASTYQLSNIPWSDINIDQQVKIGEGSFAGVLKGTWNGKAVAVKRMKFAFEDEMVKKFTIEIDILARLNHPNIIKIFGKGEYKTNNQFDPVHYFMVMEYLPLGSLFQLLHGTKDPVSLASQWQLAKDMACGLFYLHKNNILHKDIKSQNVLISIDPKTKLLRAKYIDFGESKIKSPDAITTTGDMREVGSLAWMAPEIMQAKKYTTKSDVYSYGMVLWELVETR